MARSISRSLPAPWADYLVVAVATLGFGAAVIGVELLNGLLP